MALTKFDICSQALIKCGADTISSFADGTHESNVCSVMYDTIKKSLLYYTFWNFAIIKVQMNRLTETPADKKFSDLKTLHGITPHGIVPPLIL